MHVHMHIEIVSWIAYEGSYICSISLLMFWSLLLNAHCFSVHVRNALSRSLPFDESYNMPETGFITWLKSSWNASSSNALTICWFTWTMSLAAKAWKIHNDTKWHRLHFDMITHNNAIRHSSHSPLCEQ